MQLSIYNRNIRTQMLGRVKESQYPDYTSVWDLTIAKA